MNQDGGEDLGKFRKSGFIKGTKLAVYRNVFVGTGLAIFFGTLAGFVYKYVSDNIVCSH
jgi:hypothetical protein